MDGTELANSKRFCLVMTAAFSCCCPGSSAKVLWPLQPGPRSWQGQSMHRLRQHLRGRN